MIGAFGAWASTCLFLFSKHVYVQHSFQHNETIGATMLPAECLVGAFGLLASDDLRPALVHGLHLS